MEKSEYLRKKEIFIVNVMAKLCIFSLLIMLYVHYCFGLPTVEELYNEDEVRNICFEKKKTNIFKLIKILIRTKNSQNHYKNRKSAFFISQ